MDILQSVKAAAKGYLSEKQTREARRAFSKIDRLRCSLYRHDLTKIAAYYGTDKCYPHSYTQHYQQHFGPLRRKKLNILEIGIGGGEEPRDGGPSLRMWKTYFPKANVYGIDLYDKSFHDERRIKTFRGSQTDEAFLAKVMAEIKEADIIIDDGSHYNEHVIKTFNFLFPLLSPNGIYVIEDTQTSYSPAYGGSSEHLDTPHTMMGFMKSLIDGLNYEEFIPEKSSPTYFDKHIVGMHFYHNLIFIYKGLNNENAIILGKA